MIFDSHKHYKQLIAVGSTPDQADMLVNVITEFRVQLAEYLRTPPLNFDSHRFYKRLVAVGGTPAVAEAYLEVMRDFIGSGVMKQGQE